MPLVSARLVAAPSAVPGFENNPATGAIPVANFPTATGAPPMRQFQSFPHVLDLEALPIHDSLLYNALFARPVAMVTYLIDFSKVRSFAFFASKSLRYSSFSGLPGGKSKRNGLISVPFFRIS